MGLSECLRKEGLLLYINKLPFPTLVINSSYEVVLMNEEAERTFGEEGTRCYELTHNINRPCWEVFGESYCPLKNLEHSSRAYSFHEHDARSYHLLVGSKLDEDIYMEMYIDKYIGEIIKDLRLLADFDSLTGVFNRRKIEELLAVEIERAKRYGKPLSVLFVDIDNFKDINDSFGHMKGDQVLREVAMLIKKELRSTDHVGRFGGEEFLIILPETKPEEAVKVAERIRRVIERCSFDGVNVTVSVGVTGYSEGESLEDVIDRVDKAMYRAKMEGKNRVVFM